MPATALQPSGDQPSAPKTCDASGMAEIHRLFTAGFAEAPRLVAGAPAGDTVRVDALATHLDMLSASLHAHHEGEDARLWDRLAERAPACAAHVERMKMHHAQMLVHLVALDDAVPGWRASAGRSGADAVLAALDGVNAALAEHLPDEEANIVPVMETVLSVDEAEWFGEHGRKATPKGQTWNMLGAILAAQPDGGDAWMRKNLPAPVRLIWKWIGKPKYRKNRAVLEGR